MAAGLQCWDASGKLVVDIGDYNTRYLGRVSVGVPAGATSVNIANGQVTKDGSFASIVAANGAFYEVAYYCARTYDGGFTVYYLGPVKQAAVTLTVDIHGFI